MSKEIYISSTPHETRLAIVENDALTEIYYERENEYTLAGSIYNGKVTRVLPGMQSSFVDIGLERDAFLYITDFMEEAGDSADFEATHSGGDGRSRGGNRERSGNRDQPALPAPEASAAPAISEESANRSTSDRSGSDRSSSDRGGERGGRDRGGRGRRDRNRSGSRDRGPRTERTEGSPQPIAAEPNFNTADADFGGQPSFPEANGLPDRLDSDLGEGAPGADGSRRWRGRRGRRRGRGDVPQAGDAQNDVQIGEAGEQSSPATYDDEFASTSYIDASAAEPAETPAAPRNTAPIASAYGEPTEQAASASPDQPRRDRDRGGRGGRNRGRGGRDRDRGPRPEGNTAEALPPRSEDRAPRGEDRAPRNDDRAPRSDDRTPRTDDRAPRSADRSDRGDRGGRDRGPRVPRGFAPKVALYGVDSTPAYGEPAYGDAPEAPAGEPIILPGESLSKYRKGEEAPASAPKSAFAAETIVLPVASGFTVSSDWDGGSVLPGETLSRNRRPEGQRSEAQRSEARRSEPSASHRSDSRSDMRAAAPAPVAATPVTPVQVAATEYEPTEASASYRIDPVAQSEFRQSAPVAEPVAEVTRQEDVWDWQQPAATEAVAVEATTPAADITTLQPTGELLSAVPAIEPGATPAQQEIAQPANPIHHETAVVTSFEEEAMEEEAVAGGGDHVGNGKVAEAPVADNIDELHASAIEEMDDFDEEETLEGAADLGTMIREMSIDQITRPVDAEADAEVDLDSDSDSEEEDYEDFEEEDSIDDHLASDSDESDTEANSESSYSEDSDSQAHGFAEVDADSEEGSTPSAERAVSGEPSARPAPREGDRDRSRRREGGRRDGGRSRDARRDGRDRDRSRNTGGAGDRERSGRSRQSMQSTNLPAISDLLKPGQEVLVQIAKEPIAKKGARITSHIALPGRFLVFMPTVNHTGVSRKIESDAERRRLKEILLSEKGEASGGFIVRTAASGASEEELRSDLRFLLNLWTDIKTRSESSKSPALIYHDLNLVERILRDQVTDNFSAIWVDTESDYERILRFLQRFQPSLIRRVKLYSKETPLFEQFGITEEINKALRSKVWLKSGGSIVINQTEALVAIDINTGKFVGKTARLEDTIVKTNLDAIPEIVRQIRLRDLGGIIIIDFIDMDERKNRNRVMAALEDELKSDRAPSKVLQFNDFGLVAITRKRVKQSLERTLSTTCNVCVGTGMVKSPITVCNDIYIEMRKMHKNLDRGDVMLRVHPEVVKALKSPTSKWLQEMEEMCGRTILVKSDPALHPEQFDIH